MSPKKPEINTLKEIKIHKEERKKWKEEKQLKKIKKQLKEQQSSDESTETTNIKENPTISIAIAGTILEDEETTKMQSYLVGQIARIACVFKIDEVVIYDDYGDDDDVNTKKPKYDDENGVKTMRASCVFFGRILQYLECPQYLRKYFFPMHKDLQYVGLLNPVEAPHHLRQDNKSEYREGITTDKPVKPGKGSRIDVGLLQDVHIEEHLNPHIRCTVRLLEQNEGSKKLKGVVVPPTEPRQKIGAYWGYKVRLANSISKVFSQCPYKDGYDLTIGMSDNGTSTDDFTTTPYNHLLIVFGGSNGLEYAFQNDNDLNVDDPSLVFNYYLSVLPHERKKTIQTDEAVVFTLTALGRKIYLTKYNCI